MAYSGSSYWDSTTTPVPGCRLRTCLAASMPSRWNAGGMRMSVTITWGGGGLGATDQLVVVGGRPHDPQVRLDGQ